MTIIISVLGNGCIQSDAFVNITAKDIMHVCDLFANEHYIMPEEIFVVTCGKVIEMDLQSMIQSELEKQLQEKTT